MKEEDQKKPPPPLVSSDGIGPTAYGEPGDSGGEGQRLDAPLVSSSGGSPTWADDQLQGFLDAGAELPPELAAEQKAVLLKPGDVVAGRFEVVKQLGFGGMGSVYRVKDRELHGEECALKVMLPSLLGSETARERFLSEVSISGETRGRTTGFRSFARAIALIAAGKSCHSGLCA